MKWCILLAAGWGTLFFTPAERAARQQQASGAQLHHYTARLETPRRALHWVDGELTASAPVVAPGDYWVR